VPGVQLGGSRGHVLAFAGLACGPGRDKEDERNEEGKEAVKVDRLGDAVAPMQPAEIRYLKEPRGRQPQVRSGPGCGELARRLG
jgi:hypothetical protein